ncbi:GNAT family N-acetyltransferase [Streptomyces sp. NPDC048718]|uniref:GNAT family N-acetyltransferase n=1 Tax=Streptomyces sp. NPDC048718 TaxID=3365587 RepID=UPI003720FF50
MTDLLIVRAIASDATPADPTGSTTGPGTGPGAAPLTDWRLIHNAIIPTAPLSEEQVRERAGRNLLDVAYADGVPVGCSTVRPPDEETPAATVISRILPEYRGRGFGTALYERGLGHARTLSEAGVETVVLASNTEGLRFARARGFVETERYLLPGDTVPFVTLRLAEPGTGTDPGFEATAASG